MGKALVVLDQVEAAAREWGNRAEAEGPLSGQILVVLHDRFSQEMEAADQIASVVGEAAQVFNKSLETVGRFSGWEIPAVTDELAKLSDRFQEMKTHLQEFRDTVEGWKAGRVGPKDVDVRLFPCGKCIWKRKSVIGAWGKYFPQALAVTSSDSGSHHWARA